MALKENFIKRLPTSRANNKQEARFERTNRNCKVLLDQGTREMQYTVRGGWSNTKRQDEAVNQMKYIRLGEGRTRVERIT